MPRIQKHVYLAFEVRGKNLKPEDIEPLVNELWQSEENEYKSEIIKLLKKVMSP